MKLEGSLLLAHPNLLDPNFQRSVIYVSECSSDQGAFGLILNRPSGKLIGDVIERPLGLLSTMPICLGGPVQAQQMIFASFVWEPGPRRVQCRHHISIEEAQVLAGQPRTTVRAYVGYAGWSPGQLESELRQKTWLVHPANMEGLFEWEAVPTLWRRITRTFGPWFDLMAAAPENPERN
jgi:putative transcriptional regulator